MCTSMFPTHFCGSHVDLYLYATYLCVLVYTCVTLKCILGTLLTCDHPHFHLFIYNTCLNLQAAHHSTQRAHVCKYSSFLCVPAGMHTLRLCCMTCQGLSQHSTRLSITPLSSRTSIRLKFSPWLSWLENEDF